MGENRKLLINGEAAFPEIIRCIENAKRSVAINMFIWRDDVIGNRMAEAVLKAADKGVRVYISIDRYGVVLEKCEECKRSFFHKQQSLPEKMKICALGQVYPQNGRPGKVKDVDTALYKRIMEHPNIEVSADVFKADHSKWYIIDDEILFLGGINVEDKENGCDINGNVYGDYMVKLSGRAYVEMFRHKLRTGGNTAEDLFFGINQKVPDRRFEMEQLYLDLIRKAETTLHITMAYFSPLRKFIKELVAAHKRGVRVTLVIPENANFQNASNRRCIRKILKATDGQAAVYLCPKMLHTKLVMNDRYISLGSTNITKKAFNQLDELNLFVKKDDSPFTKALMCSVAEDIKTSKRVCRYQEVTYNPVLALAESFLV